MAVYTIGLAILVIIAMGVIVVLYDEIDEVVTAAVQRARRRCAWHAHRRRLLRSRHRR